VSKTWMPGTRPGMTDECEPLGVGSPDGLAFK
jgi:hypothetical protein